MFHLLKRKWEREHHELEETKRILKESGVNVAQCLATLPERHEQPAQGSRPVSKRRASFPAAPLRRISLRAPPSRASLLRDAGPALEHANTTVAAIAEEREDGDGDAPQKTPAVATPDDANNKPEANNNESAGSTNNNNNKDEDKSKPATSPPVTTRRKG